MGGEQRRGKFLLLQGRGNEVWSNKRVIKRSEGKQGK